MNVLRGLRIGGLAVLVSVGVLGYPLACVGVNGQPDQGQFVGWVAVVSEEPSANDQVRLTVDAAEPGVPGARPILTYSVAVCGPDRFEGHLLIGGDARLTPSQVASIDRAGPSEIVSGAGGILSPKSIGELTVSWPGGEPIAILKDLDVAHLLFESPPACLAPSSGDAGGSFQGSAAFLVGTAQRPIRRLLQFGPFKGPREAFSFPLIGAIPGTPYGARGVFLFSGGLDGKFSEPTAEINYVGGGGIAAQADIEEIYPSPDRERSLTWASFAPFASSARIVNTANLNWWQNLQVATAMFLGVSTSVIASLLLGRPRPIVIHDSPALPRPAPSGTSASPLTSPVQEISEPRFMRTSSWGWALALLVLAWAVGRLVRRE